jgi:3-methylcrotonyl-CoA carboxylase alpha subunit
VDTGFGEGDSVSPFYDSMIAKLIVWGEDRAQALARLDAALRDTHLVGLHNNVAFLRRVVGSRSFAHADLDTGLIGREGGVLFGQPPLAPELAAAGVVARVLADEAAAEGADPWSRRDGWRLHGGARRRLDLELQGQPLPVVMQRLHDGATTMQIGEQRWALQTRELPGPPDGRHDVQLGSARHTLTVYLRGDRYSVFAAQGSATLTLTDPLAQAGEAAEGGRLTAPMPGKLLSFLARSGEQVSRGQPLAVMEAMKMEHTISAPRDGRVEELLYAPGDQVAEGAELLRLSK